ncbi:MAG TPA: SRPBCC family protein [Phycisphaerales bacterium]|nr:SRPBCC family protein [Phycisphaerales bacterium]
MARLAISETVNAPLGRTFEAFSDLRSAEKNISGIKRLEILTDGPIGKGTRFKETRVMFGREATETMEVTQWEPRGSPASYAIGGDSCGARFETIFRFHPERQGAATRVEMEMTVKAMSLFAKVMSPLSKLMMGPMKKSIAGDLADMKRVAEIAG